MNEKKVAKNIARLKWAIQRSTDYDFAIMKLCVDMEYEKRNFGGQIDVIINEYTKLI